MRAWMQICESELQWGLVSLELGYLPVGLLQLDRQGLHPASPLDGRSKMKCRYLHHVSVLMELDAPQ